MKPFIRTFIIVFTIFTVQFTLCNFSNASLVPVDINEQTAELENLEEELILCDESLYFIDEFHWFESFITSLYSNPSLSLSQRPPKTTL